MSVLYRGTGSASLLRDDGAPRPPLAYRNRGTPDLNDAPYRWPHRFTPSDSDTLLLGTTLPDAGIRNSRFVGATVRGRGMVVMSLLDAECACCVHTRQLNVFKVSIVLMFYRCTSGDHTSWRAIFAFNHSSSTKHVTPRSLYLQQQPCLA